MSREHSSQVPPRPSPRRTKIVATLGPATDDPAILRRLFAAGCDVARINYSHQTHADHARRVEQIRSTAAKLGVEIGIMADLQGPKIRIERFVDGRIVLEPGHRFIIDAGHPAGSGSSERVGVTYKDLPRDVERGNRLLIDDGRVVLEVEHVRGAAVECIVVVGGVLSNNKGLNREGGGLSAGALTRKDRSDLAHAVGLGVDYIAVSFTRTADDIVQARKLIRRAGGECGIIAKIERAEALQHLEGIIAAADGVMVARGDLGVEIGDAQLAPVQKRLIKLAREMNRVVITATQMMESMIENPLPTRAEVFDVANAVLDGTDAVMLSAETSVGRHPDKAVEAMARVCIGTEGAWGYQAPDYHIDARFEQIDEAIAMSAIYAGNRLGARAVIALTETGTTPRTMSRLNSGVPIFAFTRHKATQRRVTLFRGVYPIAFDVTHTDSLEVNHEMIEHLQRSGFLVDGDLVIITKGDLRGYTGGTNCLKIVQVGRMVEHCL